MEEADVLDVEGAARLLKMSKDWVYRRSAEGTLPCRKLGSKTRFIRAELEAWLASLPGGPRK